MKVLIQVRVNLEAELAVRFIHDFTRSALLIETVRTGIEDHGLQHLLKLNSHADQDMVNGQTQSLGIFVDLSLGLINVPVWGSCARWPMVLRRGAWPEIAFLARRLMQSNIPKVPSVNIFVGKQPLDADLLPYLNTLSSNLKLFTCHMLTEQN